MGTGIVFRLEDFHIGEIYKIASISADIPCVKLKDAFECTEITETHIVLKYLTQEEVIERLGEDSRNVVVNNLLQQLLRIVSKEKAAELIECC
jgi:hypothetical protein